MINDDAFDVTFFASSAHSHPPGAAGLDDMALMVLTGANLVLPDHGFVGAEGALRILYEVNWQVRRIDVSHNLLGPEGAAMLMAGLNTMRVRLSDGDQLWGIRELNLANNRLDDTALDSVLKYAKKDPLLAKVMLQGNEIQLLDNGDRLSHVLNSSQLRCLSMNNNSLSEDALIKLFDTLAPVHLTELHLSACQIRPTVAPHIASFLSSPRSRNLQCLSMNANRIGPQGVAEIVDAVEKHNFTLVHLGLLANDVGDDVTGEDGIPLIRTPEQISGDQAVLQDNVHERLPSLMCRNRDYTRRVRNAALTAIGRARIVLHASPASDHLVAWRALDDVRNESNTPRFPILQLPREVLYNIVGHMSGDARALSSLQYNRLIKEAEDRGSILRARALLRDSKGDPGERNTANWNAKEEWLRKGGWNKWEQ